MMDTIATTSWAMQRHAVLTDDASPERIAIRWGSVSLADFLPFYVSSMSLYSILDDARKPVFEPVYFKTPVRPRSCLSGGDSINQRGGYAPALSNFYTRQVSDRDVDTPLTDRSFASLDFGSTFEIHPEEPIASFEHLSIHEFLLSLPMDLHTPDSIPLESRDFTYAIAERPDEKRIVLAVIVMSKKVGVLC